MIVRINASSNRHNGHYGIVYKGSEIDGRLQVLFLLDENNRQCIKPGWAHDGEYEIIPDEENRDTLGWPPALCDSKIHTTANDLAQLVADGRKYRQLMELIHEDRR